ncbi:hypothetical protein Ae201684P_020955 [Aphanomyces euteiches]|nr:hypothetical protein Ae201684P_020955 [Aphanomyces euteiches]
MPSLDSLSRKRQPSIFTLTYSHRAILLSTSCVFSHWSRSSGIHVCLDLPRHFQTLCKRIDPDVDLILTQRLSLRPSRAHSEIFYPMGHLVPNIWQSPFNVFARQRVPSSPDSRWTD